MESQFVVTVERGSPLTPLARVTGLLAGGFLAMLMLHAPAWLLWCFGVMLAACVISLAIAWRYFVKALKFGLTTPPQKR